MEMVKYLKQRQLKGTVPPKYILSTKLTPTQASLSLIYVFFGYQQKCFFSKETMKPSSTATKTKKLH